MTGAVDLDERAIAATTAIAVDHLLRDAPEAVDLMWLLAHVGAEDIPRRMLLAGAAEMPDDGRNALRGRLALVAAAAALHRYGLVHVGADHLAVHRTVQSVVRDSLGPDGRERWAAVAGRVLRAQFPTIFSLKDWPWLARLLPHAITVIGHLDGLGVEPALAVELQCLVSRFLLVQGQFGVARARLEDALAQVGRIAPGGRLHARVLNLLAVAEREFGLFLSAEQRAGEAARVHASQQVVTHGGEGLTPADPAGEEPALPADLDLAEDLHNLGVIAQRQGRLPAARTHLDAAYDVLVRLPDEGGVNGAEVQESLAGLMCEVGDWTVADEAYRRAIEIRERVTGADAVELAVTRTFGALITDIARRTREGLDMRGLDHVGPTREIVRLHQDAYGPRHPVIAEDLRGLGFILRLVGERDEAGRLIGEAQDLDVGNFGPTYYRLANGHVELMTLSAMESDLPGAQEHLRNAVDVVLALPAAERENHLTIAGLGKALADVAVDDAARPLLARVVPVLVEAGVDDRTVIDSVTRMVVQAATAAGDHLLATLRLDDAEVAYRGAAALAASAADMPLGLPEVEVSWAFLAAARGDAAAAAQHCRTAFDRLPQDDPAAAMWWLLERCGLAASVFGRATAVADALDVLFDEQRERGGMVEFHGLLSGVLPSGWFAKESVTLLAPDGQANVIASTEPLDPGYGAREYANEQGELLRREFESYRELSFEEVEIFGGRRGYLRSFDWTPEGQDRVSQIQVYYAENGRGFTATATTPSANFARIEPILIQALRGLRIPPELPPA